MAQSSFAVGKDILDIGSRKASARGPAAAGQAGQHVPLAFGLPNVANVSAVSLAIYVTSTGCLLLCYVVCTWYSLRIVLCLPSVFGVLSMYWNWL